jgi:hypothetical protein
MAASRPVSFAARRLIVAYMRNAFPEGWRWALPRARARKTPLREEVTLQDLDDLLNDVPADWVARVVKLGRVRELSEWEIEELRRETQ